MRPIASTVDNRDSGARRKEMMEEERDDRASYTNRWMVVREREREMAVWLTLGRSQQETTKLSSRSLAHTTTLTQCDP